MSSSTPNTTSPFFSSTTFPELDSFDYVGSSSSISNASVATLNNGAIVILCVACVVLALVLLFVIAYCVRRRKRRAASKPSTKAKQATVGPRMRRRLLFYKLLPAPMFLATLAFNIYLLAMAAMDIAEFAGGEDTDAYYGYLLDVGGDMYSVQFILDETTSEVLLRDGPWAVRLRELNAPTDPLPPIDDGFYPTGDYGVIDTNSQITITRTDANASPPYSVPDGVSMKRMWGGGRLGMGAYKSTINWQIVFFLVVGPQSLVTEDDGTGSTSCIEGLTGVGASNSFICCAGAF